MRIVTELLLTRRPNRRPSSRAANLLTVLEGENLAHKETEMKAALAHASAYISESDGLEEAPHVCKDCGQPIPDYATYCDECIQKSIASIAENSTRWLSAERAVACGAENCDDCPMRELPEDCAEFVAFLDAEGERLAPAAYKCNGVY